MLHGQVPALVGGCGADDGAVDRHARIEQPLLARKFDDLDVVLLRTGVDAPALDARIDERADHDVGDNAWLPEAISRRRWDITP